MRHALEPVARLQDGWSSDRNPQKFPFPFGNASPCPIARFLAVFPAELGEAGKTAIGCI
jgi:hypothetical protein